MIIMQRRTFSELAPDFALDLADYVDERLLGVHAYHASPWESEALHGRDAIADHLEIHVRLTPRGGFGQDLELDDEIRRKTMRESVGAGLEPTQPSGQHGQAAEQGAVVEIQGFHLADTGPRGRQDLDWRRVAPR